MSIRQKFKVFNVGGALMAIFIFFITGLFSWFGSTTLNNKEESIKTTQVLISLNNTLKSINKNIEHLNLRIEEVATKEAENEKKLYKLSVDVQKGD